MTDSNANRFADRFELVRRLGSGGQASVWLATDERGERVAIKSIDGPMSESARRRFRHEVECLRRVRHDGICVFREEIEHLGSPALVMDYVPGAPLSAFLDPDATDDPDALPPRSDDGLDRLLDMFEQLALALDAAHRAGVVHRDVKPGNIVVRDDGHAVLVDFGLALGADMTRLTNTREATGTWYYMSPEQIRGESVGPASDLFSLGVSLYECLVGSPPFVGDSRTEIFEAVCAAALPKREYEFGERDRELFAVLSKLTEKDSGRRYLTGAVAAEDMARVRRGLTANARPPSRARLVWSALQRDRALRNLVGGLAVAVLVLATFAALVTYGIQSVRAEQVRTADALRDRTMLADLRQIDAMEAAASELYPPWPETIPKLEEWLERARGLAERLPKVRAALDALAVPARPDRALTRMKRRHAALVAHARRHELGGRESAVAEGIMNESEFDDHLEDLRREIEDLEFEIVHHVPSEVAENEDELVASAYAALVRRLERFCAPGRGAVERVEKRLEQARQLERLRDAHGDAWMRAIESVRTSPVYGGLVLRVESGMLPIGQNPVTGLYEFVDVLSAHDSVVPTRDDTARIPVGSDTGIIWVLVPAGRALVGAQGRDDAMPHYESLPETVGYVAEGRLDAFFISKFEMTQGQWSRLVGSNPSWFRTGRSPGGLRRPVEEVSWRMAIDELGRYGMTLPTEAQWEYACRAGTETPWYFGADPGDIRDHGFVAQGDRSEPAVVGLLEPSPWGLYDLYGNVWEWTRDQPIRVMSPLRPGDGARYDGGERGPRVLRGGHWQSPPMRARSSYSSMSAGEADANATYGVRPIRRLRVPGVESGKFSSDPGPIAVPGLETEWTQPK